MNELTLNAERTMSSREIAELVESRHADVCRAIERLMVAKAISEYAPMAYTHPQNGQSYTEYRIGKRDSYVVVAQLSPAFTARLVDRWQSLEAQVAQPALNLNDPSFLRTVLLEYTEKVLELQQTVEAQKPAVEFAHAVRNTEDGIGIGDMARLLGTGQNRLFRRLREDHILMPTNRPYQQYLDRDYFRVIENVWFDAAKEPHPTFRTLVTGRGQVYLQRKYGAEAA